jgi:hypothetical protein
MDLLKEEQKLDMFGVPLNIGDWVYDIEDKLFLVINIQESIENAAYAECVSYFKKYDCIMSRDILTKFLKKVDIIAGHSRLEYDILLKEYKPLIRKKKLNKFL